MKPTRLIGYVLAGAGLFAAGYAFGAGDPIGSLRKEPANMLTVGVLGANSVLQDGRISVESGKLVIAKSLPPKGGQGCTAELESLRVLVGPRYDKNGVKIVRAPFSKYFLPAEEQNSEAPSVLARRDAIEEATIVRMRGPGGPGGTGCEGPLVSK
jgi:hypothetical protein